MNFFNFNKLKIIITLRNIYQYMDTVLTIHGHLTHLTLQGMFRSLEGMGVVILKDIITGPFNYTLNKMAISKFWLRCVWGNWWAWRGLLVAFKSLSIIKKVQWSFSISNRMCLFLKFLRQQMTISKFLSDAL